MSDKPKADLHIRVGFIAIQTDIDFGGYYWEVVTGNSIPLETLSAASFDWTTIRYNVLVLRPVNVTECAVTKAGFSTKVVEVEFTLTGETVE